jgi:hypothetical protein
MEDFSLHILDIAENSIRAGATIIKIRIEEDIDKNLLLINISDNGKGMDEEMVKNSTDPFFTTKGRRRIGLGLPLLAQAARESLGDFRITSEKGRGTVIESRFQYNHIDRKPIGDMTQTLIVLITANPDIDFLYEQKNNRGHHVIDTREIKKSAGNEPVSLQKLIKIIRDTLDTSTHD